MGQVQVAPPLLSAGSLKPVAACLTIHSSRRRFAARLNSGVRRMPGPLSDCYVLSPSRSSADALLFLRTFVPDHSPQWDDSDPSEVLGTPIDMTLTQITQFLEAHPELAYSMYFRNNAAGQPYF